VVSYDLFEETFSVTKLVTPRRTAPHLDQYGCGSVVLQQIPRPDRRGPKEPCGQPGNPGQDGRKPVCHSARNITDSASPDQPESRFQSAGCDTQPKWGQSNWARDRWKSAGGAARPADTLVLSFVIRCRF